MHTQNEPKTATPLVSQRYCCHCKGVNFGDYDGDRFPDLYVSNLDGPNRLFKNRGDGTFVDVALKLGVFAPMTSFGCWFFDSNNDGKLDLWVNNYGAPRSEAVCSWYLNHTSGYDVCRHYENDGRGGFRDATAERAVNRAFFPMGCSFGDLDNDGYQDAYLATGDPDLGSLWPNVMLRNDRGRRYQDVTTSGGFGILQKGHGVAFGDIDNDGDQDVFTQTGGAARDDMFWNALFLNPGHGHRWITVRLRGVRSNRFGVGARIRVRIEEPAGERDVFGFVGSNSSFGGNSYQQELGPGQATRIVELEVFWPTTGATQRFTDVPLDRFIAIDEGATAITLEERVRAKLWQPVESVMAVSAAHCRRRDVAVSKHPAGC